MKAQNKHLLFIIILVLFAYINILPNQFTFDDNDFMPYLTNKTLRDIPTYFQGEVLPQAKGSYGPLALTYWTISHSLWDENPTPYHIQAIIILIISSCLVYLITKKLASRNTALFTASIFAVHPIHTESISWITASTDTMAIMWVFLAFYLYLSNKRILSLIPATLGFFTHELSLTLPFLIILYEFTLNKDKKIFSLTKKSYPYFLLFFIYSFIRTAFIVSLTASYDALNFGSRYHTFLAMTKVFLKYISLLILPFNLSVNHTISKGILSFGRDTSKEAFLAQSIFDPHIILSILVILFVICIAIHYRKKKPLITFGIGWFFISLLPVSNIIPQGGIIAERYLFNASFGFCLLAGALFSKLLQNKKFHKTAKIILIVYLLFLTFQTIDRNQDWQTEFTLWDSTTKTSPTSVYAWNNAGHQLLLQNQPHQAIEYFQTAIQIQPHYSLGHNNIGIAFLRTNQPQKALTHFRQAIENDPTYLSPYINIGDLYFQNQDYTKARLYYKQATMIDPNNQFAQERLLRLNHLR